MTDELKPCAHCGGKAIQSNDVGIDIENECYVEFIECVDCGVRCKNAEAWNTRPQEAVPLGEEIERLAGFISIEAGETGSSPEAIAELVLKLGYRRQNTKNEVGNEA